MFHSSLSTKVHLYDARSIAVTLELLRSLLKLSSCRRICNIQFNFNYKGIAQRFYLTSEKLPPDKGFLFRARGRGKQGRVQRASDGDGAQPAAYPTLASVGVARRRLLAKVRCTLFGSKCDNAQFCGVSRTLLQSLRSKITLCDEIVVSKCSVSSVDIIAVAVNKIPLLLVPIESTWV